MGCHYRIFNLPNIREIHLFNRCVHFVDKNANQNQNWSFDLIYFQRSEVYPHWFSHMCLILLLVYMRNRRIFIGKREALPSWQAICLLFLVVSSLVGLVTTQILICENQIIRRLEIPLRTIVAPLIKINCNGRFEETGKEYLKDNYCGSQRYEIYCSQLRA